MTSNRPGDSRVARISLIGMMAAIVFVGNYLRIPFMDTKLTAANALCVLSGLLFGPGGGFLAAGIGSFLFDIVTGYGAESLITFASKGAIGLIAGLVGCRAAHAGQYGRNEMARVVCAAALGAFAYVALYMLKTFVFGLTVNGLTLEATGLKMAAKLPGSVINAVFASVAGPVLFSALRPALRHAGLFDLG